MECPVCTGALLKPVSCAACQYAACQACARRYVLMQTDPSCMSCRAAWDRDVLVSHFGAPFVNGEYKTHREAVLFDRERALLPETQERLPQYREAALLAEALTDQKREVRELLRRAAELKATIRRNADRVDTLKRTRYAVPAAAAARITPAKRPAEPAEPPKKVLRACPCDDCRGFVYDDHVCGACGSQLCRKCHEPLREGHECAPDDVASAEAIMRDSKPCPSCAAVTYRISGCTQMWCIACKTPWNWRTGEIERGPVHNPEYFRWLARTGGAAAGGAAGGPGGARGVDGGGCGLQTIAEIMQRLRTAGVSNRLAISEAYRQTAHLVAVAIPSLRIDDDGVLLRLKFLNGEVDEKQFQVKLQRNEKKHSKNRAIRDLLETYVQACRDIVQTARDVTTTDSALKQIEELRAYVKAEFHALGKRYNSTEPSLQQYLRMTD